MNFGPERDDSLFNRLNKKNEYSLESDVWGNKILKDDKFLDPSDFSVRRRRYSISELLAAMLDTVPPIDSKPPKTGGNLEEEVVRLRRVNSSLTAAITNHQTTVRRLEDAATTAKSETKRLGWENNRLRAANEALQAQIQQLRLASARREAGLYSTPERNGTSLDPDGYCRTLGLDPKTFWELPDGLREKMVQAVYRQLSLVFHPDTGTGNEARMRKVNSAKEVLGDTGKRRLYEQRAQNRRAY